VRLRHALLIAALAGLPAGLALVLVHEHSSGPGGIPGKGAPQISLNLKGGVSKPALATCGATHHFTAYPGSGTIRFEGTVIAAPRGHWKVKVKLKSCIGGQFEPAGEVQVKVRHDATFKGGFRAPVAGVYFARANLNLHGRRLANSGKEFFLID